ncbi:QacE family quaternary ammonium compound efflux SMR transporter [Cohnella endophytica]|uniref:QacE family quaternary ammonium compound efflux SMR transporter n=1 Tax=Cohnella endophytica TaxID=2419778 RepID=A0A494X922_9BACL|nr:multidrug efflux SMR transporter [Cohnella endophytica]RKP47215.1 QacE family quaternary ammonium compound efflux SMR transporter [Cohnella endophytica]
MNRNRFWLLLLLAGLCEVGWVSGLKHADNVGEWVLTAVGIVLSFMGLIYVTRILPVGTAYAIFTGIGAAGTVLAETIFFGETLDAVKIGLVIVMIIGIAGLKMTSHGSEREVEE